MTPRNSSGRKDSRLHPSATNSARYRAPVDDIAKEKHLVGERLRSVALYWAQITPVAATAAAVGGLLLADGRRASQTLASSRDVHLEG